MPYRLKQLQKQLPTVHLVAVSACVFILGLTLMLLPSEKVEATRGSIPTTPLNIETTTPSATQLPDTNNTQGDTETIESPAIHPPIEENWVDYTIGSGDNLTSMFKKAGLTARDVYNVASAAKDSKSFTRLFPGQTLSFVIKEGELHKLRHRESELKHTLLTKTPTGFNVDIIERKPDIEHKYTAGTIQDSLFLAGEEAGLSSKKIMELASIFGWDVDFVLDIRKGDSFSLIYEEKFLDGKKIGEGPIIAAQFINRGSKFTALRYTNSEGDSSYFTPEGYSMRKAFLRAPVGFARISSKFSLNRKHPVLNRIRAHKGVDYAARTGTPIKAAGDGKIIFRGKKGGFGNVVIVQHGSNITTLYAHMSKFKGGQKTGTRIKQGQVIGFVGQTGLASGPHLHYEFRVNGVHKNPLTVKLPQALPIAENERPTFKSTASALLAQLETYQATTLAALDTQKQ
ncbi:OapA family protein [Neptuniibacter sp. 1_MG-2023]|uniref:OapA family protein n=1 Tax=Neptuniibacter sp. 1_MG-2023 TaxID=3062662 RepID=UPI0026E2BAF3|nr:peptidoglycan DD-metalloendopeptidase family protein [Neptuniibacter sp. 1_MG-2023]MDO6595018.1 peptidoglycan DD-metalloendopeptidase family protein [Neptuniibacter sp. 1_MG-2023]